MDNLGPWLPFLERYIAEYATFLAMVASNATDSGTAVIFYEEFAENPPNVAASFVDNTLRNAWGNPFPSRPVTDACAEKTQRENTPYHYPAPREETGDVPVELQLRLCA